MTKIPGNIKLLSGCEIGSKLLKQEICPVELINYYLDNIINYRIYLLSSKSLEQRPLRMLKNLRKE